MHYRYPIELEKAIEQHLENIKSTNVSSEVGINQMASVWTMELLSFALTGVKSQVQLHLNTKNCYCYVLLPILHLALTLNFCHVHYNISLHLNGIGYSSSYELS